MNFEENEKIIDELKTFDAVNTKDMVNCSDSVKNWVGTGHISIPMWLITSVFNGLSSYEKVITHGEVISVGI